MAKTTVRRKSMLDNPEEVLTLAQRLLDQAKLYWKWLALGLALVVLGLAAWYINAQFQARREARAAVALVQVRPQLAAPGAEAAKALEQVIREHPGTKSAREARLLRANLLYQMKNYAEAAQAYEALLPSGDPDWDALVKESLSYCYEEMGDYKKAAATLKDAAEHLSGPLKSEIDERLAVLFEKAGDFKEAAVYWQKLINEHPDPAVLTYLKEKLAADEAKAKK